MVWISLHIMLVLKKTYYFLFFFFKKKAQRSNCKGIRSAGEKIHELESSLEINKFHIINMLEMFDLMSLTSLSTYMIYYKCLSVHASVHISADSINNFEITYKNVT